jgi:hypothetical protein
MRQRQAAAMMKGGATQLVAYKFEQKIAKIRLNGVRETALQTPQSHKTTQGKQQHGGRDKKPEGET